jgi:nicotinamide mononucleotide adenylyltransferase
MAREFDFTKFFSWLGKEIVLELQRKMIQQKGVDGGQYATLATSTVKAKMRIAPQYAYTRMITTRDFLTNAFKFRSVKNYVEVFIDNIQHGRALRNVRKESTKQALSSSAVRMTQIAEWQNKPDRSLFFPTDPIQIEKLDTMKTALKEFQIEADKQTAQMLQEELKLAVRLG